MQLEDWLDDLCVRFIVNIPAEELNSIERICFQIEEAQWFYEDFIRPEDPTLPSLALKPFFHKITQRCPIFQNWPTEDMGNAFEKFLHYKNRVPVRGVVMLNDKMDEVVLVKGFKKSGTWSFPRGKINKDEDDLDCAIREAWEETGFDVRVHGLDQRVRGQRPLQTYMRQQEIKLFVIRDVPRNYGFVPQTRKEISKVKWFKLTDLPTEKKKKAYHEGTSQHLALNANKFYMVSPFMNQLKDFIKRERKQDRQSSKLAAPPMSVEVSAPELNEVPYSLPDRPQIPMSPSNLPEVTVASVHDPAMLLKQQLNISPTVDTQAKGKQLLSLLRGGPTAEMRPDPHTPLEQTIFPRRPQSPERPGPAFQDHLDRHLQSPPPEFHLYPQAHPVAPSSSALPAPSHHTQSLLDLFNRPSEPSPAQAKAQLDSNKQNLLASLMSKPISPAPPQPQAIPPSNPGQSLLRRLQQAPQTLEAPTQPALTDNLGPPFQQQAQTMTAGPQAPRTISKPENSAHPLLSLLQRKPADQPATPQKEALSSSANPDAALDTQIPARRQVEPAELSATSDHETKTTPVDKIQSLLGTVPRKTPKSAEPKTNVGSTAATLSGPIDEPQFNAIAKVALSEEEIRREPVPSNNRKLFDPKHDNVKHVPAAIKILSKQEDKARQPKSPRMSRTPKQPQSPRRPVTPKEAPKPFQPQILKRPSTSDGDSKDTLLSLLRQPSQQSQAVAPTSAAQVADLPLPATQAPQVVPTDQTRPVNSFTAQRPPIIVQDPAKAALLSLLKTPTQTPQTPSRIDTELQNDTTPKASMPSQQASAESVLSPPAPSHIVSPILDGEVDQSTLRSRVSSLASAGGMAPSVERRQTAAGDKAFLLSYLKGFASQSEKAA